mgnify:CR=1 FL=1
MSKWISDLEPWNEDKPKKLSVGDACRRIKDFRLRLNQLTQDIELDGQPLEAEKVEEAYIDFSLINYAITKDQAIDAVYKVARSRAYDPVMEWLLDIESDDSIVPVDLGTIARDYLGVDDKLSNRMFVMALLGAVWRRFHPGCKFDAVRERKEGVRSQKRCLKRVLAKVLFRVVYGDPERLHPIRLSSAQAYGLVGALMLPHEADAV